MNCTKIGEFLVTYYGKYYFFFTEEYEFVFFMSEENILKFLDSGITIAEEKIDPVILDDVYRHMANPSEV